ncbi:MAG: ribose-5-phosphate isomerase RpiA [Fibrobacter sp.]|nr:ribose-5-phosphate isomerase RpiA [Fibrobacter sp.]
MSSADKLKQQAAIKAANMVKSGDLVGIGTGSTVNFFIEHLAHRIKTEGMHITGVSTSWSSTLICQKHNILLQDLGQTSFLDIAVDGADEIDPQLNLIKGRGAAHLMEKIVATLAQKFVIIADESKLVPQLGQNFAVPLELLPCALGLVESRIQKLGGDFTVRQGLRKDGPVISDSGNLIADAKFPNIENPATLSDKLQNIPGLLEHGMFIGLAHKAIVAKKDSIVEL